LAVIEEKNWNSATEHIPFPPYGDTLMTKALRIGMLGCGFMGRTHSNAHGQVGHFFDREYQPVLKACYGREEDREELEAFAEACLV
jgi:hypothetical protein